MGSVKDNGIYSDSHWEGFDNDDLVKDETYQFASSDQNSDEEYTSKNLNS